MPSDAEPEPAEIAPCRTAVPVTEAVVVASYVLSSLLNPEMVRGLAVITTEFLAAL